jgi:hypothetical protein
MVSDIMLNGIMLSVILLNVTILALLLVNTMIKIVNYTVYVKSSG